MRQAETFVRQNLQAIIDRFFNEDWFIISGLDGL